MNMNLSYPGVSPLLQTVVQITCIKSFICKLGYLCLCFHTHTHICICHDYTNICEWKEASWNIYFRWAPKLHVSEQIWAKSTLPYFLACIHCTVLLVFSWICLLIDPMHLHRSVLTWKFDFLWENTNIFNFSFAFCEPYVQEPLILWYVNFLCLFLPFDYSRKSLVQSK